MLEMEQACAARLPGPGLPMALPHRWAGVPTRPAPPAEFGSLIPKLPTCALLPLHPHTRGDEPLTSFSSPRATLRTTPPRLVR